MNSPITIKEVAETSRNQTELSLAPSSVSERETRAAELRAKVNNAALLLFFVALITEAGGAFTYQKTSYTRTGEFFIRAGMLMILFSGVMRITSRDLK